MVANKLQETRVYQEAKAKGREEGRKQGERSLILEQLTSLFGTLPQSAQTSVINLPGDRLKPLSVALLRFSSIRDLERWLQEHAE